MLCKYPPEEPIQAPSDEETDVVVGSLALYHAFTTRYKIRHPEIVRHVIAKFGGKIISGKLYDIICNEKYQVPRDIALVVDALCVSDDVCLQLLKRGAPIAMARRVWKSIKARPPDQKTNVASCASGIFRYGALTVSIAGRLQNLSPPRPFYVRGEVTGTYRSLPAVETLKDLLMTHDLVLLIGKAMIELAYVPALQKSNRKSYAFPPLISWHLFRYS